MADVKEIMEFWEKKIRGIMEKYGKQERITTDEVQGLCDRLGISLGNLMAAMIVINNLLIQTSHLNKCLCTLEIQ